MQPRESKPVLIRSDCLGQLEHADPKAACTGNIADHLFLLPQGSIVGLWGYWATQGCILSLCWSSSLMWTCQWGRAQDPSTDVIAHILQTMQNRTVGLSFLRARVQICLQAMTQAPDLLFCYSCLNEPARRALPSWSHPDHNWNLSERQPVAAPPALG